MPLAMLPCPAPLMIARRAELVGILRVCRPWTVFCVFRRLRVVSEKKRGAVADIHCRAGCFFSRRIIRLMAGSRLHRSGQFLETCSLRGSDPDCTALSMQSAK